MADYKPTALDPRDVGVLRMGSPARAAMFQSLARVNPGALGGFAAAEGHTLKNLTEKAYSENADVNRMLNELAQSEQYNDYMKNMGDVAGKVIAAHGRAGYVAPTGSILGALYPELADVGKYANQYDIVGDTANIGNVNAQALQRDRMGRAALQNAAAAQTRANAAGGPSTSVTIEPISNTPTVTRKFPGNLTQAQLEAAGIDFSKVGSAGVNVTPEGEPVTVAPSTEDDLSGEDVYDTQRNVRYGEGMAVVGEDDVPDGKGGTNHVIEYQTEGGKQVIDVHDADGNLIYSTEGQE